MVHAPTRGRGARVLGLDTNQELLSFAAAYVPKHIGPSMD